MQMDIAPVLENPVTLTTSRLILRQWRETDLAPFVAMNANENVMAYYPATLTRQESEAYSAKIIDLISQRGWGFWALELRETGEFIGFTGLHIPGVVLPFTPCVEIGWRLGLEHWGKGYATEAAREALRFGFETLSLDKIVSFTSLINLRSQAVMERLGMVRSKEDFEHPAVDVGHRLRSHCLYRLSRDVWSQQDKSQI